MPNFYKFVIAVVFVLAIPVAVLAIHQVGGQIEMRAVGDRPGHFFIIVTNYLEAGPRADRETGGTLGVFRKRDDALMTTFVVRETGQRQPVIYSNTFCSSQRNLNFIVVTFQAELDLDPAAYNDTQGYYISFQTRNRNGGLANINDPTGTGFTFYLEFPALLQNGQYVTNSSPRFGPINGEYICAGKPFTFPFGGTDPDGDELRYSMVTPLDQKGPNRGGSQNAVSPAPYPDVRWLSGFSADRAIPGSPPLSVDPKTGQLSITATQLGLFVFAVKVEEFRNGVKIGEVRRDFQFLVVDCPPTTTPDPTVQIKDRPGLRDTTICQGNLATLLAKVDTSWNYQWQRDGVNLLNATSPSLSVREPGDYTVVVSPKAACSQSSTSESLRITVVGSQAKLSTTGHLCATTGTVTITATGATNVTYQWYRDGQPVPGQTADSLATLQPGRFWSVLTYATYGCVTRTDTVSLARSAAVVASIQSATGQARLCPQETLRLTGSGGTRYAWQHDGLPVSDATGSDLDISQTGTYVLTATDGYGCQGTSSPFVISPVPPVTVLFDSLPGVCGPDAPAYALRGSPASGVFAGTGVEENQFSPKLAGIGNHALTYTVKAAPECKGTVATRTAVVAPIPAIDLADSMATYKGNTFTLAPVVTGNATRFQWTAGTYLDNDRSATPAVQRIGADITYVLDVENNVGCTARDTIHITVYSQLGIPDAFSPNGDGLNDVWQLPGIEAFPDAVVTVFNRWGEVIYLSDKGYPLPFDGTLNGTPLPAGLYTYTLRTVPERPVQRGSLLLLR